MNKSTLDKALDLLESLVDNCSYNYSYISSNKYKSCAEYCSYIQGIPMNGFINCQVKDFLKEQGRIVI